MKRQPKRSMMAATIYAISSGDLETYLIPRRDIEVTVEMLRRRSEGIAYTRSPFAYLFQLENT